MLEYETPQILSLGVLNVDFVMELGPERVGKKKMGKQISISAGGHRWLPGHRRRALRRPCRRPLAAWAATPSVSRSSAPFRQSTSTATF